MLLYLQIYRVSPLTQTLETPLLYGILKVTDTLSPNLSCVSLLTQTLDMLLLFGILIVTVTLQPHFLTFFFFFSNKFSIVISLQIDWYGLQWDSFLSIFSILSIMAQVCPPKPNQMNARDR